MEIRIDKERCNGCGSCVEACPTGAMSLMNGAAVIDYALCAQCEACIDVCPSGAITALVDTSMVVQQPAAMSNVTKARPILTRPQPWLSSALVFAGQTILPRLVDVLITAVEHKLAQPTMQNVSSTSIPPRRLAGRGRGQRRRARRRGGHIGNRNYS